MYSYLFTSVLYEHDTVICISWACLRLCVSQDIAEPGIWGACSVLGCSRWEDISGWRSEGGHWHTRTISVWGKREPRPAYQHSAQISHCETTALLLHKYTHMAIYTNTILFKNSMKTKVSRSFGVNSPLTFHSVNSCCWHCDCSNHQKSNNESWFYWKNMTLWDQFLYIQYIINY